MFNTLFLSRVILGALNQNSKIKEICHTAKCHNFACDKLARETISADYTNNIDIMFEAPIYMLLICSITHNMLLTIC